MIEVDRERHSIEVARGEVERRLREIDAVIVADARSVSALFIMLASPQAMSRKSNGRANRSLRDS
jgi:hypothetical protein